MQKYINVIILTKKIGQLNVEIEILEIQTDKLAKELQRLNQ